MSPLVFCHISNISSICFKCYLSTSSTYYCDDRGHYLLFSYVFTYLIVSLPYCIISTQSNVCPLYTLFSLPFLVNVLVGRVEVGAGGGAHWVLSTPWWHRMAGSTSSLPAEVCGCTQAAPRAGSTTPWLNKSIITYIQ